MIYHFKPNKTINKIGNKNKKKEESLWNMI